MPGTSAGMRKAWDTRRAKYGPSGRADGQTVSKSSTGTSKKSAGGASSTPKSSRNSNKAQRVNKARDIPFNADLDRAKHEREDVLAAIRKYDRDRSRGKFPEKPKPGISGAPAWAVAQSNELRQRMHKENVIRLRELDDYINRMEDWLLMQERKKYGRRYKV